MTVQPLVIVSPAARDWLRQREAGVFLRAAPRHGCCGGTAWVPVVEVAPAARVRAGDAVRFIPREVEGVPIALDRALFGDGFGTTAPRWEVGLDRLWRFERPFVRPLLA